MIIILKGAKQVNLGSSCLLCDDEGKLVECNEARRMWQMLLVKKKKKRCFIINPNTILLESVIIKFTGHYHPEVP